MSRMLKHKKKLFPPKTIPTFFVCDFLAYMRRVGIPFLLDFSRKIDESEICWRKRQHVMGGKLREAFFFSNVEKKILLWNFALSIEDAGKLVKTTFF